MKLGINVFVRDKDDRLVNRHTFMAADEVTLRATVESFEYAVKCYSDGYTIMHTPLIFIMEENDNECKI